MRNVLQSSLLFGLIFFSPSLSSHLLFLFIFFFTSVNAAFFSCLFSNSTIAPHTWTDYCYFYFFCLIFISPLVLATVSSLIFATTRPCVRRGRLFILSDFNGWFLFFFSFRIRMAWIAQHLCVDRLCEQIHFSIMLERATAILFGVHVCLIAQNGCILNSIGWLVRCAFGIP